MKSLMILFVIVLLIGCSKSDANLSGNPTEKSPNNLAVINDLPDAVKEAFKSKFPDAKSVKWEIEGEIYEAEFTLDGSEFEAEFDKDGNWLATENEIKIEELPDIVIEKLKSEYPGYEIEEAESIVSSEFGETYEVELEKGDIEVEVLIDKSGTILKTEVEEEDDDDDDDDDD